MKSTRRTHEQQCVRNEQLIKTVYFKRVSALRKKYDFTYIVFIINLSLWYSQHCKPMCVFALTNMWMTKQITLNNIKTELSISVTTTNYTSSMTYDNSNLVYNNLTFLVSIPPAFSFEPVNQNILSRSNASQTVNEGLSPVRSIVIRYLIKLILNSSF